MKNSALLTLDVDSKALENELELLLKSKEWIPHFNKSYYNGQWNGINLIGKKSSLATLAPDHNTENQVTDLCDFRLIPKTKCLLDFFETSIISARYLRLQAGSEIKTHSDPDIGFWDGLVRIHIPIVTNDHTWFIIDKKKIQMAINECWYADFGKPHSVINHGDSDRIHLVLDIEVNEWLKTLFKKEGILSKTDSAPDRIEEMSNSEITEMIFSLKTMNTETALKLAREIELKYKRHQ